MNKQDFNKYRFLARIAKENQTRQWLNNPNIVGVSFGRKFVHSQLTDEPSIVVYVMKKVSKTFLPLSQLLPRKIFIGGDCIDVDVVETGPFHPFAFTAFERPAPSGISVGHPNISAGTLGCLVTDLTDGTTCILSNNHVLANQNAALIGDIIIQPGTADGGIVSDNIGNLKRFQTINAVGNTVDAAIAEVDPADVANMMKGNFMPVPSPNHPAVGLLFAGSCNRTIMNPIRDVLNLLNIDFINGGPGAWVSANIGDNVEKVGRTTEYTSSTVLEIDATLTINYDFGPATFDNQIVTAWMSQGGDSGSIVCLGGEGGNETRCDDCGATSSAKSILQRDIREDVAVEKVFRQKYLANTLTGRFMLDTYFRNEEYILERLKKVESSKKDVEYFQHLYDKYAKVFRNMALNPEGKETLSSVHIKEGKDVLGRLKTYLGRDEQNAAEKLLKMAEKFEGKAVHEALKMLDDRKLYNDVVKIVSNIDSLKKKDC